MTHIYFLGGGNMCAAMLAGLSRDNTFALHVIEQHDERRQFLQAHYPGITTHAAPPATLKSEDVLVLAVKPQDMQVALRTVDSGGALVLSIAAGLPCALLARWLDGHERIVRIMPNTPAQVGCGMAGLYAAAGADAADKALAQTIMQSVGEVLWVADEDALHAVTAISGSGPGYVFYLMDALYRAALSQGFGEEAARKLVQKTFQGAAELALQSDLPFETLQHNVTSKGGTTYAALQVFEQAGLDHIIGEGVAACARRSREMGAELE